MYYHHLQEVYQTNYVNAKLCDCYRIYSLWRCRWLDDSP